MKQLPLPVQLRPSSVFASFYSGSNASVVERLRALDARGKPIAVWVYGPAGVGKTHLLQAVCAQASTRGHGSAYFPLRDARFEAEMLAGCESLAFVCIDDVEEIAGQAQWERALFRLYTEFENGGRLVLAAKQPPAAISFVLKDLASRLAISEILRIESLSDEEQSAALTQRAVQLGLELPNDVTQFLLRRLPRDMTSLCDALDALDRASLATQRRLTVPFVRAALHLPVHSSPS